MTGNQNKSLARFSFPTVLSVILIIKIASLLLHSIINKVQEPALSWSEAFSNWTVYSFLFPFLLTVAVYFFCINMIYRALEKESLLQIGQAISIAFVLFIIYTALAWKFEPTPVSEPVQPGAPAITLAILLGAIVDTFVVSICAYLFYLRDARKKKTV